MNGKDLYDSMEFLDDDLIHEAEVTTFRKSPWKSFVAAAAVLVLLIGAGAAIIGPIKPNQPQLAAPPETSDSLKPPTPNMQPTPPEAEVPVPTVPEKEYESPAADAEAGEESPSQDVVIPSYDPQWDAASPMTEKEFVLSNGVMIGMTYDEVLQAVQASTDSTIEFLDSGSSNFSVDNVLYGFSADNDGTPRLNYLSIGEESSLHFGRDFHIGESIDDVFAKIPAQDTELKQWARQTLYEKNGYNSYLEYVALSYYMMRIETPTMNLHITFSHADTSIIRMDVSGPGYI